MLKKRRNLFCIGTSDKGKSGRFGFFLLKKNNITAPNIWRVDDIEKNLFAVRYKDKKVLIPFLH
jgi:hypothetical protein